MRSVKYSLRTFGALLLGLMLGVDRDVYAQVPELPRSFVDTTYSAPPADASVIRVPAGGNLQAALDAVQPGQILELEAGATYTGNFVLRAKSGAGWIHIRSSRFGELPRSWNRVNPSHAPLMAKLMSVGTSGLNWGIRVEPMAGKYRLIGLEVTKTAGYEAPTDLFRSGMESDGSAAITDVNRQPHDIIIDRCYFHGTPSGNILRAIRLDGLRMAVIDSYLSDIHHTGNDAQAILTANGSGPYTILNNYLESSGENFMSGGEDPAIRALPDGHPAKACNGTVCGLVPSDFEIRRNYFFKPLRWRANYSEFIAPAWSVKNTFELKNAQRMLLEGNIFENSWVSAQDGSAILIKSTTETGKATWSVSRDVTISNNIIRSANFGIRIAGRINASQTSNILISNNLLYDISNSTYGKISPGAPLPSTGGVPFELAFGFHNVKVDHNTADANGTHLVIAEGSASTSFAFTNNLVPHNAGPPYAVGGFKGAGYERNIPTLQHFYPGYVVLKNAFIGGPAASYPADNFIPSNVDLVGYENRSAGNYALQTSSPYRNLGTDGRDLGANIQAVQGATSCVVSGQCEAGGDRVPPNRPANFRFLP